VDPSTNSFLLELNLVPFNIHHRHTAYARYKKNNNNYECYGIYEAIDLVNVMLNNTTVLTKDLVDCSNSYTPTVLQIVAFRTLALDKIPYN